MPQYLNPQGVSYLWSKIKQLTNKKLTFYSKKTADWNEDRFLISEADVLYIYKDYKIIEKGGTQYYLPGLKIGDGGTYLIDLPFVNNSEIEDKMLQHMSNQDIHVTLEQKSFWDNKLNVEIQNENLVFNRE